MKIRALSVFEGVVYADEGPLLLSVADYIAMLGATVAVPCLDQLAARGRVVDHLGVGHITFPFWTPLEVGLPGMS